jgi:hypothetical protein
MELARPYIQRGRGHAGLGKQPTRCQLQSRQGTLPAVAVRAVSIDLTEYASAILNKEPRAKTARGLAPAANDVECRTVVYRGGDNTSPFDGQGPALKKSI